MCIRDRDDRDYAFEDSESFEKHGFTKQEFDSENEELVNEMCIRDRIMEENETLEERIAAIKRDIADLIPKHITKEDIFASINYNMHLELSLIHI